MNSYCLCTCGIENEFLEYISEDGYIDEDIYQKIEQCITVGECPHVQHVPDSYVKETSIYGIHIASGVGTTDGLKQISQTRTPDRYTGLFHLEVFDIAIIKSCEITSSMTEMKKVTRQGLRQAYLVTSKCQSQYFNKDDKALVESERTSLLVLCVRKTNLNLIRNHLRLHGLDIYHMTSRLGEK